MDQNAQVKGHMAARGNSFIPTPLRNEISISDEDTES